MQPSARALFGLLGLVMVTAPAWAASPQFLGTYRDWNLQTYDDGDSGKVCYISSEPTKEDGDYTRRGPAAVLVAKLPMDAPNEQVSVQPGYAFKQGSSVDVDVDGRKFELFTRGEHAWTLTSDDDKDLIEAMKRGSRMTVRGTSTKDTFSLDTYSLLGFTAAYQKMRDACK
ncbi:MAG: hypothetical protein KDG89_16900 [Geminicoccaceae bacterium]|nr:hypothetical protein [Geminicoccaceae bacterium]